MSNLTTFVERDDRERQRAHPAESIVSLHVSALARHAYGLASRQPEAGRQFVSSQNEKTSAQAECLLIGAMGRRFGPIIGQPRLVASLNGMGLHASSAATMAATESPLNMRDNARLGPEGQCAFGT